MFYQIFLLQQMKRCAIISYKHGIYELPHELPLVCIVQLDFAAPKNITLNFVHYFIIKIANKQELQQITFKHILTFYKKCTAKPYYIVLTDTTLSLTLL